MEEKLDKEGMTHLLLKWTGYLGWMGILLVLVYLLSLNELIFFRSERSHVSRGMPVAKLMQVREDVRVQDANDLVWNPAAKGESLYEAQSIMTAQSSEADIAFEDGLGIWLGERSLVVIERRSELIDGGSFRLSLQRGKLRTKNQGDRDIAIQIGEHQVLVPKQSKVYLGSHPEISDRHEIQVEEGTVSIISPDQTRKKIGVGELGVINRNRIQVSSQKLYEVSPNRDQEVSVDASGRVEFRAKTKETIRSLSIQLSRYADFSKILNSTKLRQKSDQIEASLNLGSIDTKSTYYWRVVGKERKGSVIGSGRFNVRELSTPELILPIDQGERLENEEIYFSWKSHQDYPHYEVQINRINEKEQFRQTVSQTFVRLRLKKNGAYRWRVRGLPKKNSKTKWSSFQKFRLKGAENPVPLAPPPPPGRLKGPEITPDAFRSIQRKGWIARLLSLFVTTAYADEVKTWNVRLSWDSVPGVHRYHVQVARTRSFQVIVSEGEVSTPSYSWKYHPGMENTKGRLFYRVASIGANGAHGGFSSPQVVPIPENIRVAVREHRKKKAKRKVSKRKIKKRSQWRSGIGLGTGIGSLAQSSDTNSLQSVKARTPYIQQKVRIDILNQIELSHKGKEWEKNSEYWFSLHANAVGFRAPDANPTFAQSNQNVYTFRLDALRWAKSTSEWQFFYGVSLDYPFRWEKESAQSVKSGSALTLGPMAAIVRKYKDNSGLRPKELGVVLFTPLTGWLTGGAYGAKAEVWGEWKLVTFSKDTFVKRIGLRLDGGTEFVFWSEPNSTRIFSWSFWLSPTVYF